MHPSIPFILWVIFCYTLLKRKRKEGAETNHQPYHEKPLDNTERRIEDEEEEVQ